MEQIQDIEWQDSLKFFSKDCLKHKDQKYIGAGFNEKTQKYQFICSECIIDFNLEGIFMKDILKIKDIVRILKENEQKNLELGEQYTQKLENLQKEYKNLKIIKENCIFLMEKIEKSTLQLLDEFKTEKESKFSQKIDLKSDFTSQQNFLLCTLEKMKFQKGLNSFCEDFNKIQFMEQKLKGFESQLKQFESVLQSQQEIEIPDKLTNLKAQKVHNWEELGQLKNNPLYQQLELSIFKSEFSQFNFNILTSLPLLKSLTLNIYDHYNDCANALKQIVYLSDILRKLTKLNSFTYSQNFNKYYFLEYWSRAVIDSVQHMEELQDLNLIFTYKSNNVGNNIFNFVGEELKNGMNCKNSLRCLKLDLQNSSLTSVGAITVSKILKGFQQLKVLDLGFSNCTVNNGNITDILEGLTGLPKLHKLILDFRQNSIKEKGVQQLAKFLYGLTELKQLTLFLYKNNLCDNSFKNLFENIENLKNIIELQIDLSYNSISFVGQTFQNLKKLQKLKIVNINLQNNNVSEQVKYQVYMDLSFLDIKQKIIFL